MCYRCKVCDNIVPHGTPLLRHTTYRTDTNLFGGHPGKQILQEFPVCGECKKDLDDGMCPREMQLEFSQLPRPARTPVKVGHKEAMDFGTQLMKDNQPGPVVRGIHPVPAKVQSSDGEEVTFSIKASVQESVVAKPKRKSKVKEDKGHEGQ